MSKLLRELREKQSALKTEATALLDLVDTAGRDLSAEEETRFNLIEAELATIATSVATEEAKVERRRRLDAVVVSSATHALLPANASARLSIDRPPAEARDQTGGFQNLADFARAVHSACRPGAAATIDPRLGGRGPMAAPTTYMEGNGSAGEGFELPVYYRDQMWDLVMEMDDIMTMTDLEPTNARQVDWIADETTPWGSSGVQAYWRAEGAQMTASNMSTKGRSVSLHELYAFVLATEELLEDAPRLNTRITRKSAEAINWKINDAVVNGTGAGQPLGWMNSASLITVTPESGQGAATIRAANVLAMYTRLLVAPGDTPRWLANRDVVPQLSQITIGDKPVWLPPNGLMAAPGGFLLGLPIQWSEHAQTLGTVGDVQLISPKGYYAARRTSGLNFATSMHLYFDYAIQAFRWTFRFGGQPHLSAAVSPANGSTTKSHFVVLAGNR